MSPKNDHAAPDDLTLFDYEILGLVGRDGASAYDLRRMARHGRILDWAGESQYFTEPKRLARLGYLQARKEPGKTRERVVYRLTEKARTALRRYARTPVHFQPIKNELLLRLLICDLVGEGVTRETASTIRADIEDLFDRLDQSEAGLDAIPHRRKHQLLIIAFLRRLLDLHLELVDEIERELAPPRRAAER